MNGPARCRCVSPATARRCTLRRFHVADHERRGRSGRLLETWPHAEHDADHATTCTSAELIDHLQDLIDLAKMEGFGAIVGALERAAREIRGTVYRERRRRRARPHPSFGWSRGPEHVASRSRT